MQVEIWKPMFNHDGAYEISSFGRVRNKDGTVLKTKITKYGYLYVRPYINGKYRYTEIHRYLMLSFFGEQSGKVVNHIDGNKQNNHISNLEYVSTRDNTNHSKIAFRDMHAGVRRTASGKYSSQITINRKIIHLGTFSTALEASNAYKNMALSQCPTDKYIH